MAVIDIGRKLLIQLDLSDGNHERY
ncbi:MAG: hypothetical protein JWO42_730, partial [Chloroflexi bacterium]|nr:hypothetical protein [Chloroflexota bacterium]